ncbi:hypothetical protein MBLNU459_g0539t1 [Dothideomycetes sp. NU459]
MGPNNDQGESKRRGKAARTSDAEFDDMAGVQYTSPPISSTKDDEAFLTEMDELRQPSTCDDWGAKLQYLCESFWSTLDDTDHVDAACVRSFISLLSDERSFSIAKLVVPELRAPSSSAVTNEWKRQIIDATNDARNKSRQLETTTQADFDHPLYRQEKEVFTDSEMYRARLLLHRTGRVGADDDEAIRKWLEMRPKALQGVKKEPE